MKTRELKRLSFVGILLPLAAFTVVNGCASAQTAAPEKPAPEKPAPATPAPETSEMPDKIITETGNGHEASVKIGQRLLIKLGSNPTTGYEWGVAETDEKLLAPDGETEFDVPTSAMAGAPTVQTLFFKAKAKGKVALELHYARPWEKDKAPEKIYKVTVNITE